MPVDFDKLTLRPCLSTFGRDATFDPIVSRPGGVPYTNRVIFSTHEFDYQSVDGAVFSDQQTKLGIRLADFVGPPPSARDNVTVNGDRYVIDDIDNDGEGGAVIAVRKIVPDFP